MQSQLEEINPVQRRVKVSVPANDVAAKFLEVFKNIQKKAAIKGFRKGKAPIEIIKKFYSDHAQHEVSDALIKDHLFKAIEEHSLRPVAPPVVENGSSHPSPKETYEFCAVIDVMPKLELPDNYKDISFSVDHVEVSDEQIQQRLDQIAFEQAKTKAAEAGTTIAADHQVKISHDVFLNDQEVTAMKVKDHMVVVGRGQMYPDLERALLGMTADETKDVHIQLPDDYQAAELAGKELLFKLSVSEVNHLLIPELDDELAKDLGFDDFAKLRDAVSDSMHSQADQQNRAKLETTLLGILRENHPFEVPPAIVDSVIDNMIDSYIRDPGEREKAKKDDGFRKNLRPSAKERVQNSLLVAEITRREAVKVDKAELDEHIGNLRKAYPKEPVDRNRVEESMIAGKVMEKLISAAKIVRNSKPFADS